MPEESVTTPRFEVRMEALVKRYQPDGTKKAIGKLITTQKTDGHGRPVGPKTETWEEVKDG